MFSKVCSSILYFDIVEKIVVVHDYPDKENTEYLLGQCYRLRDLGVSVIYVETRNRGCGSWI